MPPFFDFHTHNLQAPAGAAIINLPREALLAPGDFAFRPGALYSAGVHPWWTADADMLPQLCDGLEQLVAHPQVVAIGECGFDRLRGDVAVQSALFARHVALAEQWGKPVTVHCVRAFDLLLQARKRLRPTTTWTVHGFRGAPALARQLLAAGFDLSFGRRYNAESLALTPAHRAHRETDDETL